MATLYSYPLGTPLRSDLIIGSKIASPYDDNLPITQNYSIGSILDLVVGATGAQSLQQVTNVGQVNEVSISTSNVKFSGKFLDSAGTIGTDGQVLTSNATGNLIWSTDGGGTVTSVAATHAGNAFSVGGTPITSSGTLAITMNGITAQYVNGVGNLATLLDIPGLITSLTTTGTSGVSTLVGRVLNIPNYANTQNTLTTTGIGAATLVGTVLNIPTPPTADFTSLTTTGTSGDAATLSVGVLNIPTPVIPFTSLTTTGSGVATLTTGVLNIPDYTYTEIDTLQTVTARGASSSIATNFTGSLTVNGSNAGAYFYVGGNAQSTAPPLTYDTGMAMVWNNSGGSRENEMYYATGAGATQSDNDNSYFAFINRFNTAGTPVDTTTMKLYGNGLLELAGPTATATIRNSHWKMPTTAAPNTGYILAKSSGSINLEWIQANTYNSNISGVPGTATSAGSAGSIRFDANYIYVCYATDSWRRVALATW